MEREPARSGWMETNELTEAADSVPELTPASPDPEATLDRSGPESELPLSARFRNALGNICLALLFFTALLPTTKGQYNSGVANDIWLAGAVLMGVLSLVRVPPRSAMVNLRSILATAAMMTIPALMRPRGGST